MAAPALRQRRRLPAAAHPHLRDRCRRTSHRGGHLRRQRQGTHQPAVAPPARSVPRRHGRRWLPARVDHPCGVHPPARGPCGLEHLPERRRRMGAHIPQRGVPVLRARVRLLGQSRRPLRGCRVRGLGGSHRRRGPRQHGRSCRQHLLRGVVPVHAGPHTGAPLGGDLQRRQASDHHRRHGTYPDAARRPRPQLDVRHRSRRSAPHPPRGIRRLGRR